jgi:hypothetical protein
MQNNAISNAFSPLRLLAFAALAALAAGGVACSSQSAASPSDAGDDPCAALAVCCTAVGGPGAATCQSLVAAAREANSPSTCEATLESYTQSGLCGSSSFDAGGIPGIDASVPCALTGTCNTSSFDAGNVNTNADSGLPGSVQCTYLGTCPNGGPQYETCTATTDAGACVAAVFLTTGQEFSCASCLDCASASASAAAACPSSVVVDAGPDCGTPPALHPEADAGVYCPFTPTGSIHCAPGEECCEAPSTSVDQSSCQAGGAACPITGSLTWACDGPLDCAGSSAGAVCCAAGTVANDPVCSYDRGASFLGSHCAASCVAGEVSICDTTTDPCPTGTTCTPFKVAGVVLGTCL